MYVYSQRDQHVAVGNVPHFISTGEVWDASDPVVKAWPDLFDTTPPIVHNTSGKTRNDYVNEEFSPEVRRRTRG